MIFSKKIAVLTLLFFVFVIKTFSFEFTEAYKYEKIPDSKFEKLLTREINKDDPDENLILNLLEVYYRNEDLDKLQKTTTFLLAKNNQNTNFTRNLKLLELRYLIKNSSNVQILDYINNIRNDFKNDFSSSKMQLEVLELYFSSTKDSTSFNKLFELDKAIDQVKNPYLKLLTNNLKFHYFVSRKKLNKAFNIINESIAIFEAGYYKSFLLEQDHLFLKILLKITEGNYEQSLKEFIEYFEYNIENFTSNIRRFRSNLLSVIMNFNIHTRYDDVFNLIATLEDYVQSNKKISKKLKEEYLEIFEYQKSKIFEKIEEYDLALKSLLKIAELYDTKGKNKNPIYTPIAIIYDYMGKMEESLKYHIMANEELLKTQAPPKALAISYNNLGYGYGNVGQYDKAIFFLEKSLNIMKQSNTYNSLGDIYYKMGNYEKSIEYHKKALSFKDHVRTKANLHLYTYFFISAARTYLKLNENEKALELLKKAEKYALSINSRLRLKEVYEELSNYYKSIGNYKNAYFYNKKYTSYQDSVFSKEKLEKINNLMISSRINLKQKEIEILKQERRIQDLKVKSESIKKYWYATALILSLLASLFLISRYRLKIKANKLLQKQKTEVERLNREIIEQNHLIELEKDKTDKLLLNILPEKVADELKQNGVSEPKRFNNVSVYFSDVVGFTKMSSEIDINLLISELNDIFTAFDRIIENHECERIKTIGDAYLCVCGMHKPANDHAEKILKSAIDIVKYLNERNKHNEIQWKIRIGLHTGQVVGGIVGVKKYIYDVFGDTINTAWRMESNSEPMKINLSEAFYQQLNDNYNFIPRDYVEVKGKGKMMMYFLDDNEIVS